MSGSWPNSPNQWMADASLPVWKSYYVEAQSITTLLFNTNSLILLILSRSFPRGQETRQKMQMLWAMRIYLLRKSLGRVLAILILLETQLRKVVLQAWLDSHLETLEAQPTVYRLAPVRFLRLQQITITSRPQLKPLCRLACLVKPPLPQVMKKLWTSMVL